MHIPDILQTTHALAGLAVLLFIAYRLKQSLKRYSRTGTFR